MGGSVFVVGFGGNGWDVPVLVACILACFIIAASTPVLLVLYVRFPYCSDTPADLVPPPL